MTKAKQTDKQLVIDIISNSFINNPSVLRVIKNDAKKTKRIRAMAEYVFDTTYLTGGILLSSDKTGVAICYHYKRREKGIVDFFNQVKLVVKAIGISRSLGVSKRDKYISKQRPTNGNYMYFWFFGVKDQGKGRGAAIELRNKIFNDAYQKQLPIYLETSILQNKLVYERFGFSVYHSWKETDTTPEAWFMKKE